MFLAYKDMWDMPIDPVDGLEKVKEGERAPKRVGHFVGNIVYAIIFIAFKIAFRYKVEGIENLRQFDGERGAVVIGNHASSIRLSCGSPRVRSSGCGSWRATTCSPTPAALRAR